MRRGLLLLCVYLLPLCVGCDAEAPTVGEGGPNYERFEGIAWDNECVSDLDCSPSGCSGEVCAAEEAITTCEVVANLPTGTCQCYVDECKWVR
jgi:eight-cysteine-cluster-containing protein